MSSIFDFSCPDYKYLYFIVTLLRTPVNTDFHVKNLIYEDGEIKSKMWFYAEGSTGFVFTKHYLSENEALEESKKIATGMTRDELHPLTLLSQIVIKSETGRGQEILDKMLSHPDLDVKITVVESE